MVFDAHFNETKINVIIDTSTYFPNRKLTKQNTRIYIFFKR